MKLESLCLPTILTVFALFVALASAAQREDIDVDELSQTLFPVHQQPFARQDRWSLLSGAEREAWTFAHEEIPPQSTLDDVLPVVEQISAQKLSLLVTLKIVAAPSTKLNQDKLRRYVKLMRSNGNHTDIEYRILTARPELHTSVTSLAASDTEVNVEDKVSAVLQNDASSAGIMDILYVILSTGDEAKPLTQLESRPPVVAGGRVSWIVYSIQESYEVNVAKLLVKAEVAAQRLYAPSPKFFPVPVVPILRIVISTYTPGFEQEAPWIVSFPWASFERTVRRMALVGQTVGFFVNPTNKECVKCKDSFQNIAKLNPTSAHRALISWKTAQKESNVDIDETGALETDPNSVSNIFILVVDTSKMKETGFLTRFEKSGVTSVQGASLVMVRSSRSNMAIKLQSLLIQAVAESAFGIANPGRYIFLDESKGSNAEEAGSRASLILSDIALRNAVASSIHNKLFEFNEILQNMKRFDFDPTKVLLDNEYAVVMQRANFLLYKVKRSRSALSQERNDGMALHLAAAGYHDVKAIQAAFHLQSSKKMSISDHFRDPRSKCHYSRIQERALSASELFEDQNSVLSRLGYIGITFIAGFLLGRIISLIRGKVKHDEKQE